MYAPERQSAILRRARDEGRVEVSTLAEILSVTPETIRRDLTLLEKRGEVRRVHGGAIPVERFQDELDVPDRLVRMPDEKAAIARTAIPLIDGARTLLLDAGTTVLQFAQILPRDHGLTVVTHSLTIAATLADVPGIALHILAGTVRPRTLAAVGATTVQQVADLTVDVAIVGMNGITPEFGYSTPDLAEAAVKAQILRSGRTSILLADHTKFGVNDFAHVAPLSAADVIITDADVDPDLATRIADDGPEVIRAS